jgi:hypothetical protein
MNSTNNNIYRKIIELELTCLNGRVPTKFHSRSRRRKFWDAVSNYGRNVFCNICDIIQYA